MPFVLLRRCEGRKEREKEREEARRVSKLTAVFVSLSGVGPSFVSLRGS